MREKTVESKFTSAVKAKGGLAVKFTSPGFNGMPDRLVMFPGGRIAFVGGQSPRRNTPSFAAVTIEAVAAAGLQGIRTGRHRTDRRDY